MIDNHYGSLLLCFANGRVINLSNAILFSYVCVIDKSINLPLIEKHKQCLKVYEIYEY